MTTPKPVVLCILDGWGGLREETAFNAPPAWPIRRTSTA